MPFPVQENKWKNGKNKCAQSQVEWINLDYIIGQ